MEDKNKLSMSDSNSIEEQRMVDETKNSFPVYPLYPVNDYIYNKKNKEAYLDADNVTEIKTTTSVSEKQNENDFNEDETGEDLDVLGTELDDEQENIGSEDEENNYYSIGGDNHNGLDENHPE